MDFVDTTTLQISKRLLKLGLMENPYIPYSDDRYFVPLPSQQNVYRELFMMIEEKGEKNFAFVTGELGVGKSTLARRLVRALAPVTHHGNATGIYIDKEEGTPSKLVKKIEAALNVDESGTYKKRLEAISRHLQQRTIGSSSLFLAIDTELTKEAADILQYMLSLRIYDDSYVQVAIFLEDPAAVMNNSLTGVSQNLRKILSIDSPSDSDLTNLLHQMSLLAGRATPPLFEPEAVNALILYSGSNPGKLMSLAASALQYLITSKRGGQTIAANLVESIAQSKL